MPAKSLMNLKILMPFGVFATENGGHPYRR